MSAYFDDPAHVARLRAEAAAWEGTPFRARAAVKGAGVDCVCLAAEIMVACGVIEAYEFPPYALQWAKHHERSLVLEWLAGCPRFLRVADEEPARFGDVACFRVGRCVHHVGVVLDPPHFLGAVEGSQVTVCRLDDATWQRRLHCLYRVNQPACGGVAPHDAWVQERR